MWYVAWHRTTVTSTRPHSGLMSRSVPSGRLRAPCLYLMRLGRKSTLGTVDQPSGGSFLFGRIRPMDPVRAHVAGKSHMGGTYRLGAVAHTLSRLTRYVRLGTLSPSTGPEQGPGPLIGAGPAVAGPAG